MIYTDLASHSLSWDKSRADNKYEHLFRKEIEHL